MLLIYHGFLPPLTRNAGILYKAKSRSKYVWVIGVSYSSTVLEQNQMSIIKSYYTMSYEIPKI